MTALQLSRDLMSAFAARDADRIRQLCHPDYVSRRPDGSESHGTETAGVTMRPFFELVPDLQFDGTYHSVSDSLCVAEGVLHGTAKTGAAVSIGIVMIFECKDGQVWRKREYVTGVSLLDLLGRPAGAEQVASSH